jgi:hypothetical protein
MNSRVEAAGHEMPDGKPFTVNRLRSSRWGARATTLLLAFGLVATACGGNGGPSPDKVATQWRSAYEKRDFGKTWEFEDPARRGDKGKAAYVASSEELYKNDKPIPPGHEVTDIEVTRTVEDDTQKEDFVFVYLRVTTRDFGSHQEVVTLRRVGGDWRVAKWEP